MEQEITPKNVVDVSAELLKDEKRAKLELFHAAARLTAAEEGSDEGLLADIDPETYKGYKEEDFENLEPELDVVSKKRKQAIEASDAFGRAMMDSLHEVALEEDAEL